MGGARCAVGAGRVSAKGAGPAERTGAAALGSSVNAPFCLPQLETARPLSNTAPHRQRSRLSSFICLEMWSVSRVQSPRT